MTDRTQPLTLVLGATGKTGRRVADRLTRLGWPVRSGSRSAAIPFDWQVPDTWAAALDGVSQVYVTFQPDLAFPGAREIIERFTRQAVAAGVRKLVLLSGRGEPAARTCEELVESSGAAWTVIRASWFTQNFTEGHFRDAVLSGTLALPAPDDVLEPFIDVEDIVDIAVDALTSDRHDGRLHDVTGPRLLTFPNAVEEIGRAFGRDVRYQEVPAPDFEAGMRAGGAPPELAAFLVELMAMVLDGRNSQVTNGVQRALGRPPRDFADTLRREVEAGAGRVA